MSANTITENRRIVFLKDDAGWYADMEGTRAQNAMVSGADKMIEALSALWQRPHQGRCDIEHCR